MSSEFLINFPPPGYKIIKNQERDKVFKYASRWKLSYNILRVTDYCFPLVLARSWLQRKSPPPSNTRLTYADGHLVFRPDPWVLELEYAHLLLGPDPKHINKFGKILSRTLTLPHCRKIRCWSEAGRKTLEFIPEYHKFQDKVEVIHHAVPPRSFSKNNNSSKKIKILFVGSGNIQGQFDVKGGREVLEVFTALRKKYDNIELVLRSDIPADLKARYAKTDGLKIIDKKVPWEVMDREYQTADIFLLPSHSTPPFTIMDAMSYELPIVSINAWANPEYIENGRTGLLAERSGKVPYYHGDSFHPNFGSYQFEKSIKRTDPEVVRELVNLTSILIDNPELRMNLGKAGRYEIEYGKFSITRRNERLKHFFDKAISE